ncbi:uncharacterized protein LOC144644038 [Oculina patagonica]
MKKTAASCILVLLLSVLLAEGYLPGKYMTTKPTKQMRDSGVDSDSELHQARQNGKRMIQEQRDSEWRRNLCFSTPVSWTVQGNFKKDETCPKGCPTDAKMAD